MIFWSPSKLILFIQDELFLDDTMKGSNADIVVTAPFFPNQQDFGCQIEKISS